MKKKLFQTVLPVVVIIFLLAITGSSQSSSATYTNGDIPTFLGMYSSTCNGPLTKLAVPLPSGGPWTVTGIDIAYAMTAQANGKMVDQRSYIRCQNTSKSESTVYQGNGGAGTYLYSRTNVNIANGSYPGGSILNFEMRAWRMALGTGCNTTYNKVDNATWMITVYYSQIPDEGSVGIGTIAPATSAILDLASTTQGFLLPRMTTMERDAIAAPTAGLMIFNVSTQNVEVYTSGWKSFTSSTPRIKKLFGGSADDVVYSGGQTNDGGYIAAGYTESSNSGTLTGLINYGSKDGWVFKLNSYGDIIWQKLFGGIDEDIIYDIQQTPDGGYVGIGHSSSSNSGTFGGVYNNGSNQTFDLWVFRLDANGGMIWQKLLGGSSSDEGVAIDQTSDGGFIISGYASSSNSGTLTGFYNNGGKDVWILKLNSSGMTEWQQLYGGSADDFASDILEDPDGAILVASTSYSSNSGTLLGTFSYGGADYWVLRLSSNGQIIWHRLLGGDMDDVCNAAEWRCGRYALLGTSSSSDTGILTGYYSNGLTDAWLISMDDAGTIMWEALLGSIMEEEARSLSILPEFEYHAISFGGSRFLGVQLGEEYWFYTLDCNGPFLYERLYGGNGDEAILKAMTTLNETILLGCTDSSNSGTLLGLYNNGQKDAWILKVDGNGNPY
jgi:hypothetical protein